MEIKRPNLPEKRPIITAELVVQKNDPRRAPDVLAHYTGLPKARIKEAMGKGAVWLKRGGRRPMRLRRVTTTLDTGDRLALYYDSAVLSTDPPKAQCLRDFVRYSAWHKPAGLMVEGSRFGDHATLARQVELHFGRPVHLVHRLDREASGILLVAHKPQAAARLSILFRERQLAKEYRIEVRGDLRQRGAQGRITAPLDGKETITEYEVIEYGPERDVTCAQVLMRTGRYHQIRRHFEGIGFPLMGDPKYGRGNADPRGMQLTAVGLRFKCPWTGEWIELRVEDSQDPIHEPGRPYPDRHRSA